MDETIATANEIHLLEGKSFCRLCLSGIDEQMLLFSSPTVDALFDRIRQCTGVQLMIFPDICSRVCDDCASQLVICEKFVKRCREVDQKLRELRQQYDCKHETTGQNEPFIPVKEPNNDEDVPRGKVPKLDKTVCGTPANGKSIVDELYVVEIVDANHEYEVDHYSENIPEVSKECAGSVAPDKSIINTRAVPEERSCSKGRKAIKKTQKKCSICGSMQQNLKQHMLVHTGEKKHTCPVCQKAFAQKGNLTLHMNQHTNNAPYGCDQCEKTFKDPQSLRSHKLTHSQERKFQCEVCEETFKYKCSLVVHLRAHTEDKRYACTECQRSFITSSGLKKHVRTHTGERPYKCTECSKSFKASHNLSLHKLSHTKERRFQCDLCASWFSYKNVLKTHMNVHLRDGKQGTPEARYKIEKKGKGTEK